MALPVGWASGYRGPRRSVAAPLEGAMHIDRRLLGWGVFFILVGAIPLAVRGGS